MMRLPSLILSWLLDWCNRPGIDGQVRAYTLSDEATCTIFIPLTVVQCILYMTNRLPLTEPSDDRPMVKNSAEPSDDRPMVRLR